MRLSVTMLVLAALAGPALAQPTRHGVPKAPQPGTKAAEVVFASADQVRAGTPALPEASAAPKRPAPRITHCRCGDPQPGDETPDQ